MGGLFYFLVILCFKKYFILYAITVAPVFPPLPPDPAHPSIVSPHTIVHVYGPSYVFFD